MNRKIFLRPRFVMSAALAVLVGIGSTFAAAKSDRAGDATVNKDSAAERHQALAAARQIDELVRAGYRAHKVVPTRPTNDAQFVRRVYLDVTGAIPTHAQVKAFLDSRDPGKRAKLIDELLDSSGYVSHFYNFWGDLLRLQTRMRGDETQQYPQWVKESLRENKPYDQMVYELLTAEGKARENGAAGYYLRDEGNVLDTVANTSQVFLGTQIGCAQCHDHPFDKWSQKDFYEFAAFTGEVSTRANYGGGAGRMKVDADEREKFRELNRLMRTDKVSNQARQLLRRVTQSERYVVHDDSRRELKLPKDYKYEDGKPGEVVEAHVIFGDPAKTKAGETERQAWARWMTSKENPRFAKVIANRLWKQVMGIGLVEPVDDFTDETEASNPALLDFLANYMKQSDFDLKQYLRGLLNSDTYQLAASPVELTPENYHAQGAVLRRMTAEQVWDSLVTLAVPEPAKRIREGTTNPYGAMIESLLPQIKEARTAQEVIDLLEDKAKQMRQGRKGMYSRQAGEIPWRREFMPQLVLASEMPSPAPAGHFLQEFGQSNRETINDADTNPTVPQALAMMNGPSFATITNTRSQLASFINDAKTARDKVDAAYLAILSRPANPREMQIALAEIEKDGVNGLKNVIWALINSREFIFIQ